MANGIITGPPTVDFFKALGGIGDTLQNNTKLARERELREAFKDGLPRTADGSFDFNATANILAKHGADVSTLLTIAKLDETQRKNREELQASTNFRGVLGGLFGSDAQPGNSSTSAPIAPTASNKLPPAVQPQNPGVERAPVQSSATVWGDREAEDAGLYEKPSPTSDYGEVLGGRKRSAGEIINGMKAEPVARAAPTASEAPTPSQPAKQAAGFQGIGIQHLPQLMQALANPRLPAGDRELAGKLLTRALDDAKEPEKIRTLNALKEASGFKGTILDLEMQMRSASKPQITVDQRGESEEAKAAGAAAGKRRGAMFDAANSATNDLAKLARIETLLKQVDQGKLEPARMTISAWAKSFGVNDDFAKSIGLDPKKVGDTQAVQSLVNELVIGKIGPGGFPANNFSEADRQFLTDIFMKLGNDPRANRILIEAARRTYQANVQRALDYQAWKEDPENKDKSFEKFESYYAKKASQMDRFGDLRREAESIINTPATSGNAGGIPWSVQ